MTQAKKKSIAYYVVVICLVLITVPLLFGLVWQGSFEEGYIEIPFGKGSVVFSLWMFALECFCLIAFFYMTYRTFKSNFKTKPFTWTSVVGLIAIGCCILLLNDLNYGEISFDGLRRRYSFLYVAWPFLILPVLIVVTLCFLFIKRRKTAQPPT